VDAALHHRLEVLLHPLPVDVHEDGQGGLRALWQAVHVRADDGDGAVPDRILWAHAQQLVGHGAPSPRLEVGVRTPHRLALEGRAERDGDVHQRHRGADVPRLQPALEHVLRLLVEQQVRNVLHQLVGNDRHVVEERGQGHGRPARVQRSIVQHEGLGALGQVRGQPFGVPCLDPSERERRPDQEIQGMHQLGEAPEGVEHHPEPHLDLPFLEHPYHIIHGHDQHSPGLQLADSGHQLPAVPGHAHQHRGPGDGVVHKGQPQLPEHLVRDEAYGGRAGVRVPFKVPQGLQGLGGHHRRPARLQRVRQPPLAGKTGMALQHLQQLPEGGDVLPEPSQGARQGVGGLRVLHGAVPPAREGGEGPDHCQGCEGLRPPEPHLYDLGTPDPRRRRHLVPMRQAAGPAPPLHLPRQPLLGDQAAAEEVQEHIAEHLTAERVQGRSVEDHRRPHQRFAHGRNRVPRA